MENSQKYRWWFIVLFVLSLTLRLGLAVVNREANDNHMEVVRMIMETRRLPIMFECRECFHPKLFYGTAAALLQSFGIADPTAQIVFVQLLIVAAGMMTLAIIYKFIKAYPSENELLKLAAFALVALNPKLIAINSQASNDTFAILFSTLALYFTYIYLKDSGQKHFWLLVFFILLAVSTKVTSWIAFAAIFLSFLLTLWVQAEKINRKLTYLSLLLVLVLALTTLNPFSQFVTNTQKFGFPIVTRDQRLPFPDLVKQTAHYKNYHFRPGIVSIQDGFFTFKLVELLKYPLTTNGQYGYPPQRTSFWTMLYADSHSLHFQNWPPSWQTQGEENFTVTRVIFLLALPPTLIFISGFLLELFIFLKALFARDKPKIHALGSALFLLATGGYLAFLMLASLLYRDFAFIKLAYILPGLLAFTWVFLRGAERLVSHFRWGQYLLIGWTTALSAFYIWDVLNLTLQLASANLHF
jgi:4-amino-4-deoxy-L-arabinose transferase-like glycosyltransferase